MNTVQGRMAMKISKFLTVLAGSVFWLGCQKSNSNPQSTNSISSFDVNRYAINKTVCDPLGSGSGATNSAISDPTQGLQASLFYLTANQPRYHDVESMIANGHPSHESLFFADLNVPTRLFSAGFPLQSGGSIKDDSGQELIEYFALRMEGVLHLAPDEAEGDYQVGMLSDDGTVWSLASTEEADNFTVLLNNDGDHPTKMGCGPIIHMTRWTTLRMRVDYYQGPRYHIALVPLWRNVNTGSATEPLCGQSGNSLFFDSYNNSAPTPAYQQLLARGWHPLATGNYTVPTSAGYNPCTQGTAPVISAVAVSNISGGSLTVTWQTDIPATDQVLVENLGTSMQSLTVSDNVLRTTHSVQVDGLVAGNQYSLQAVSISQDLGKAMSAALTATP
jgi:hypothetical protein